MIPSPSSRWSCKEIRNGYFDIITITVAVVSFIVSVCTYCATVRHDRKRDTLEAYNRLQTEVFDHLNTYSPGQIRSIAEEPQSLEYKVLSGYLARIEHFCVGVNTGIYDEKVMYALGHGYFDGFGLRRRIDPLLEAKNSYGKTNELYYVNIYSVFDRFDRQRGKTV